MSAGLSIDFDTADRITLLVLKDQLKYLRKELEDYKEGKWLHPEDIVNNDKIIEALELLIPYYGGTV
jgi:tRNA G37 N-methylase Trm5